MKFVIKNATVVSGQSRQVRDVYVRDGKIVEAFGGGDPTIIDASGRFLIPGVVDSHVHFREPGASHKEDWLTGSAAAAAGGVTTVLDMPNTNPPTLSAVALEAKRNVVRGRSYVDYGFLGGTQGNIHELEGMHGLVALKVYMGSSTGDLLLEDLNRLEGVFEWARGHGIPVVVHAESEKRIRERQSFFEGDLRPIAYAECRDDECARLAVEVALRLREKVGCKLHIAHLSTAGELDLVRAHRSPELSVEVAPHHLLFTMEDMKDGLLKMNPPLRSEEDRLALWKGLADGTVDALATDHAPHTLEEKSKPIFEAPAGVPGVEFLLPLTLDAVSRGQFSLERAVQLLSEGPARIFGLKQKGCLELGYDADMVLVDLDAVQTLRREAVRSKCGWSPYEGRTLKGWPVQTFVRGHLVFDHGQLQGAPQGREVENF